MRGHRLKRKWNVERRWLSTSGIPRTQVLSSHGTLEEAANYLDALSSEQQDGAYIKPVFMPIGG